MNKPTIKRNDKIVEDQKKRQDVDRRGIHDEIKYGKIDIKNKLSFISQGQAVQVDKETRLEIQEKILEELEKESEEINKKQKERVTKLLSEVTQDTWRRHVTED